MVVEEVLNGDWTLLPLKSLSNDLLKVCTNMRDKE